MRIVAGMWAGRRIEAPPGRGTRPTSDRVREAWMSAIAPRLPDARVVDLFAGSGALGLEALSRGAREVTFVERAPAAVRVLERNIAELKPDAEAVRMVRRDVFPFVETLGAFAFDVALADPPYGTGEATRLATIYAEVPFASILCIEHARDEDVPETLIIRSRRYGDTRLTFLSPDPDG